jgi:hypothetical protein
MAVIQERREVANFDEIHLAMAGEIFLKQGETEELVIEADSDLLPKLKSEVHAGRLELGLLHWYDFLSLLPVPTLRYHVTVKNIRGVIISGSGKVEAGKVHTDHLRLKASGSAEFHVNDLQAGDLEVIFSGSGKANIAGSVRRQELEISGSGELNAEELASQEARVRISGSGSALMSVQERLDVSISGSGKVRYHGQPQIVHHISGSGSIQAF